MLPYIFIFVVFFLYALVKFWPFNTEQKNSQPTSTTSKASPGEAPPEKSQTEAGRSLVSGCKLITRTQRAT